MVGKALMKLQLNPSIRWRSSLHADCEREGCETLGMIVLILRDDTYVVPLYSALSQININFGFHL